jgi:hypothetical protein
MPVIFGPQPAKKNQKVFRDLERGDTFMLADVSDTEVRMKFDTKSPDGYTAISLNNGWRTMIANDRKVIPVNVIATVDVI